MATENTAKPPVRTSEQAKREQFEAAAKLALARNAPALRELANR